MIYQLAETGSIKRTSESGSTLFLPAENNGTSEWRKYQAWLDAGNTPEPAPPPPPPAPDYIAFWDALISTGLYASIREQSFTSLPMNTLATELITLLGDAKAGRPNEAAIQQGISAILATGTFSADHVAELQDVLELSHLDSVYSLTVP